MGLFGKLFKLTGDIILTPIAVVKDILELNENEETSKKIEDISNDIENIFDLED